MKTVMKGHGIAVWFFMLMAALVAGCGSGSGLEAGSGDSQASITSQVDSSGLFDAGLTDDNSSDGALYSAPADSLSRELELAAAETATSCAPVAWGRGKIKRLGRDVNISVSGDTASVTVIHKIGGTLFVDKTDDGQKNPWEKPFEDTITRSAQFQRVPFLGWQLTKISPVEFALADSSKQTAHVKWVKASVNGTTVWEATSPKTLYDVPAGLPRFATGIEVLVEAEASNTNVSSCSPATYVFLHRPGLSGRARDKMYDDGTNGDKIAGDNIFSRIYTIGTAVGHHFAAVDVMDAATFESETTPYNSGAWGMPYLVVPAALQ